MRKLLWIILLAMLIPLASGFEFDNVNSFEKGDLRYGKATIKNAFGLGDNLAEITLIENSDFCSINCYAQGNVTLYEKNKLMDSLRILKRGDSGFEEGNIKKLRLYIEKNGKWKLYNGQTLQPGTYDWRIEGEKEELETLDWLATWFGVEVSEWALWNSSREVNMSLWYEFNEGTGTSAADSSSNSNTGTLVESNWTTEGILGDAALFDGTDQIVTSGSFIGFGDNTPRTFSFWYNTSNIIGTGDGFFTTGLDIVGGNPREAFSLVEDTLGDYSIQLITTDFATGVPVDENNLTHVVVRYSTVGGNNLSLWINGLQKASQIPSDLATFDSTLKIGRKRNTGAEYQGLIDEFGVFERALSDQEILDFYNIGLGISPSTVFNFTSITPSNESRVTTSLTIFGLNVSAPIDRTLVNVSFYHNISGGFQLNQTNTTLAGLPSEIVNFSTTLLEGDVITWAYEACDSTGDCSFSSNFTTGLDTIAPSITINTPAVVETHHVLGTNETLNTTIIDLNLDTCIFDYQGVNDTFTCGTLGFFNVSDLNNLTITVYVNDTAGNSNTSTRTWTYNVIEISQDFNTTALETSQQGFVINLSYNATEFPFISAILNYNNTLNATGINTGIGDEAIFTAIIDIPIITPSVENKSFFWQILLQNATGDSFPANSSTQTQEVTELIIQDCSLGGAVILNFTAGYEVNLTEINPYSFEANFLFTAGGGEEVQNITFPTEIVPSKAICVSPADTSLTIVAGIVKYDGPSMGIFVPREFNFQQSPASNVTQDIQLLLLDTADSTSFILKLQDQTLIEVPGALIDVQRFFPGLDEFRSVQRVITDDDGKTIAFFQVETVDYRFVVSRNNTVVLTTTKAKVFGEEEPFTITLTIGDITQNPIEAFEDIDDLTATLEFQEGFSLVSFTYTDSSGNFTGASLLVEKVLLNVNNEIICNETSSTSSAVLTCSVIGLNGTFLAQGFIERSPATLVEAVSFIISEAREAFGKNGLFLSMFIILAAFFAFIWNPSAAVLSVNVAVIFVNLIGIATFTPIFIFSMISVSILLLMFLRT